MNTTKKYIIENTSFSIMIDNTLTDLDRKVLTHLYLPIIGDKALSIYMTLYTMITPGVRESNPINHLTITKMLNLSNDDFIYERSKLEAIGLLSTYYHEGFYIYVLKKVYTGYEFFNNKDLIRILSSIIGEDEVNNLAYEFLLRSVDPVTFLNITCSIDQVFDLVNVEDINLNVSSVNTINKGIYVSEDKFNTEYFLLLVDALNLVNKDILCDSSFLDKIRRYSFLYGLTVEQMKEAVKSAVSFDGNIIDDDLDFWVRKIYDNKNVNQKIVPKKVVVKSSNKLINFLNTASPNDIVKTKYKTELTSGEIAMFDKLLAETNISLGVLNAALLYVMVEKNGAIPGYNYFLKVINTWIRAGITTAEEALKHINNQNDKQPKTPSKNKTIKNTPDWYNKQKDENVPQNSELEDISDFFKPNKK